MPEPSAVPRPILVSPAQWRDQLVEYGNPPRPRPILSNCVTALRLSPDWQGVLGWNEFTHTTYTRRATPWGGKPSREWSDDDDRQACIWLQQAGILVPVSVAADAVQTVAHESPHHPLFEWLDSLEWDGEERISTWLSAYLGSTDSPYARAVGRAWLISAIARAYRPGCKADCCLVLEGSQGIRKSTALRTLAGSEFFTDSIKGNLASKDAAQACVGVWIVEFSELESLNRTHIDSIKTFLSHCDDRYRPTFGRRMTRIPRGCVFAATTNKKNYLRDETGARRFWPIECASIKIAALARDREQLWAEAREAYRSGEAWYLEGNAEKLAKVEQDERFEEDPWQEPVRRYLDAQEIDKTDVASMLKMLGLEASQYTPANSARIGSILRKIGWERYRTTSDGRPWAYRR